MSLEGWLCLWALVVLVTFILPKEAAGLQRNILFGTSIASYTEGILWLTNPVFTTTEIWLCALTLAVVIALASWGEASALRKSLVIWMIATSFSKGITHLINPFFTPVDIWLCVLMWIILISGTSMKETAGLRRNLAILMLIASCAKGIIWLAVGFSTEMKMWLCFLTLVITFLLALSHQAADLCNEFTIYKLFMSFIRGMIWLLNPFAITLVTSGISTLARLIDPYLTRAETVWQSISNLMPNLADMRARLVRRDLLDLQIRLERSQEGNTKLFTDYSALKEHLAEVERESALWKARAKESDRLAKQVRMLNAQLARSPPAVSSRPRVFGRTFTPVFIRQPVDRRPVEGQTSKCSCCLEYLKKVEELEVELMVTKQEVHKAWTSMRTMKRQPMTPPAVLDILERTTADARALQEESKASVGNLQGRPELIRKADAINLSFDNASLNAALIKAKAELDTWRCNQTTAQGKNQIIPTTGQIASLKRSLNIVMAERDAALAERDRYQARGGQPATGAAAPTIHHTKLALERAREEIDILRDRVDDLEDDRTEILRRFDRDVIEKKRLNDALHDALTELRNQSQATDPVPILAPVAPGSALLPVQEVQENTHQSIEGIIGLTGQDTPPERSKIFRSSSSSPGTGIGSASPPEASFDNSRPHSDPDSMSSGLDSGTTTEESQPRIPSPAQSSASGILQPPDRDQRPSLVSRHAGSSTEEGEGSNASREANLNPGTSTNETPKVPPRPTVEDADDEES
ncbi:hypothetical protein MMC25_006899 [Agyrium rufum]|nr:hypothetical protein [Agyrium rufum]